MATRAKFTRLAHYSCEFGEANHIFLKNGFWQMSASLASTCQRSAHDTAIEKHINWQKLSSDL
jgi:hypothetical protein